MSARAEAAVRGLRMNSEKSPLLFDFRSSSGSMLDKAQMGVLLPWMRSLMSSVARNPSIFGMVKSIAMNR